MRPSADRRNRDRDRSAGSGRTRSRTRGGTCRATRGDECRDNGQTMPFIAAGLLALAAVAAWLISLIAAPASTAHLPATAGSAARAGAEALITELLSGRDLLPPGPDGAPPELTTVPDQALDIACAAARRATRAAGDRPVDCRMDGAVLVLEITSADTAGPGAAAAPVVARAELVRGPANCLRLRVDGADTGPARCATGSGEATPTEPTP